MATKRQSHPRHFGAEGRACQLTSRLADQASSQIIRFEPKAELADRCRVVESQVVPLESVAGPMGSCRVEEEWSRPQFLPRILDSMNIERNVPSSREHKVKRGADISNKQLDQLIGANEEKEARLPSCED